jgi:hypothetical protein
VILLKQHLYCGGGEGVTILNFIFYIELRFFTPLRSVQNDGEGLRLPRRFAPRNDGGARRDKQVGVLGFFLPSASSIPISTLQNGGPFFLRSSSSVVSC